MNVLMVFIGGGLGSVARYGISVWLKNSSPVSFPWATLTANVISSLLLGFLISYISNRHDNNTLLYALLATGFCGGFSTFSTFSAETVMLLQSGAQTMALINIGANLLVCFLAVWCGIVFSK